MEYFTIKPRPYDMSLRLALFQRRFLFITATPPAPCAQRVDSGFSTLCA
jgi:hypothetical protein